MEDLQQIESQVKDGTLKAADAVRRVATVEKTMEDFMSGSRSSSSGSGGDGDNAFAPKVGDKVLVRSMAAVATVLKIRSDGKV